MSKKSLARVGLAALPALACFFIAAVPASAATVACPVNSAESVALVDWPAESDDAKWTAIGEGSTASFAFSNVVPGYTNNVDVSGTTGTFYNGTPKRWTPNISYDPPAIAAPIAYMMYNYDGPATYTFNKPLDENDGILITDIDIKRDNNEQVTLEFLDAGGATIDPSGWAVTSISTGLDAFSRAKVTQSSTSIHIEAKVNASNANNPTFLITPAAGVNIKSIKQASKPPKASDSTGWGITFAHGACTDDTPEPVVAVPTMTQWGLILLGILLAAATVLRRRRS